MLLYRWVTYDRVSDLNNVMGEKVYNRRQVSLCLDR